VLLDRTTAIQFASALLVASGARQSGAEIVAQHLVESDLADVHSHGLLRIPQYLDEIARGEIEPAAEPTRERGAGAIVRIRGNRCFGQLAGAVAVEEARVAAVEQGVAVVTVRDTGHAGRIGTYVESLARSGILALAFCSGPRSGHRVAPFGGVEGRLATNPIAYAFPTGVDPIVADFSTSAVPEGVARRLHGLGRPLPAGAVQTADGIASEDPGVLYAQPRGTILPLGGPAFGHKGFALGLLVEVMATLFAGDETADSDRFGNNLAIVAIAVDEAFVGRADRLAAYICSTRPADPRRPVLMPGDPERAATKRADGVQVDASTWSAIVALAKERGVEVPQPG
jgi:LDH2 family malate/lactate/ureidoglycolate dehydrogenase